MPSRCWKESREGIVDLPSGLGSPRDPGTQLGRPDGRLWEEGKTSSIPSIQTGG